MMLTLLNIRQIQIKLQGITSHWSEWPLSNTLQRTKAAEGVEKREPSSIDAGMPTGNRHDGDSVHAC